MAGLEPALETTPARQRIARIVRGVGEVFLFGFALFMAIPVAPPGTASLHSMAFAMLAGGAAFGGSLLLARRNIWVGAGMVLAYLVLVWALSMCELR